ncbi:hypothetical protein ACFL1I_06610 [Candidatus Omnitrophota bacterium]
MLDRNRFWVITFVALFFALCALHLTQCYAEQKVWSGDGDGSSWSDDDNWSPAVEPSAADEALIDAAGAAVSFEQTFSAKSITVGGREDTTLTIGNFIFGTLAPDSSSDPALVNRSGGTITLQGAGVIALQGKYEASKESLTDEPSFMFWLE